MTSGDYHAFLGDRLRAEARPLSLRWLEQLRALLPVESNDVFPSDALLDHIPSVLEQIGEYLGAPLDEEIGSNSTVVAKARELGRLRHEQQASIHQLLREYEILGRLLETFVTDETARLVPPPEALDCIGVLGRVHRAVHVLMQTTVDTFIAEYTDTIHRQTSQLESFNRMVTHELRSPLSTLSYAIAILRNEDMIGDSARRTRVLDMLQRNIERMGDLLRNVERMMRLKDAADMPSLQQLETEAIVREVVRQLGEVAEARAVQLRVSSDLPSALLDPARFELILMNLISNGIKYSDPSKSEKWVEISGSAPASGDHFTLCVRDNGLGISAAAVPSLFTHFFRAHADRDAELGNEGSGLGLAIVRDCVTALGGQISVDSRENEGTCFTLVLPLTPKST